MGSALDAAKFSISQGFTGVSDPSSTFSAIDKGIKDLTDWQTKRKEDKEKLETDTATKYREAEKQAYENLPSGKNAQAQILSGLEEYKERLYTNMKLVQRGVIGANDNLIFRENGTQSFNILSDIVKDYDKQREEYIKGAEGYIDEKTGKLVEPIYGSVAAALQDMQTQIGNPDFTKLGFDSKGNGIITFYETKINEQTSTRELVLDKNGNPIPQKGLDGVNLIAYKNGRNQTALRVNLDQRTRDLVGKDSLLGKKYQTMISQGGMVGVVIDDIRGKDGKQVKSLITNAAGNLITNVAEMASVLSDNGENPSQVLNDRMWGEAKRNGADMDEKIPYDYVDLETGELKQGMKSKYIKIKTANNNQMVPILSEEDRLAAERIAQFSVYNSLERGISGGAQYRPSSDPIGAKQDKRNIQSGVDLLKKINQYTSGTQEEVTGAGEGLNISSDLKYRSVKDKVEKINGENVVVGLDLVLVNKDESTTPVNIPYYTKNKEGKFVKRPYVDILEDKYNAFKKQGAPDFGTVLELAKSQGIDLNKTLSSADRKREREVVRKVEVTEIPIITPTTALDTKGSTAISSTLKSGAYTSITSNILANNLDPNQGPDLALQLESSFGQMAEKQGSNQGSNVKFEFDPAKGTISVLVNGQSVETQKITGNDESLKTAVSTLLTAAAEKGLPSRKAGSKEVSSINKKIRTIAQIIKEDNVTPAQALVIFNAQ